MTAHPNVLFVSLARNQSRFFEAVGRTMGQAGFGVAHACFHEGGVRELRAGGSKVFNPYEMAPADVAGIRFEAYGIQEPALLIGHEKTAYEIADTERLIQKFKAHLGAMTGIIERMKKEGGELCVVQELGGFTSVLASYYAARRAGIDNWFIEPSFFRGRAFFTPNTFVAPQVPAVCASAGEEARGAIKGIIESRAVVIPSKDRLHYRGAAKKILDPKNLRRLVEKLAAKHLRGEQEEFEHIGGHVMRHLRMFLNSRRLSSHYRGLDGERPFIYYPLHVPTDFALTIRSPEYLDQYALIDYLCRIAPLGCRVVVKEHPALIGAVSPVRMRDLIQRHDNFVLLDPGINNHQVLAAASAVVTVNSKSGAEALLYGRPVIVLGNAFYEKCSLVHRVVQLSDLRTVLPHAMKGAAGYSLEDTMPFFQSVWEDSYPGELYDMTLDNIDRFSASLSRCIRASNAKQRMT